MRRAVLVLGGTVAGLAALFSYKSHVAGVAVASTSAPTGLSVTASPTTSANGSSLAASSSASPSPAKTAKKTTHKTTPVATAPTKTTPATTAPTTASPRTTPSKAPTRSASPKPSTTTAKAAPSGTFTGPDENTQYGPVQVQLTVANGKITAANDVQQPADSIGANAVSQLNSEVLTAQSANVQAVSGATYTSQGYLASVQQAVDQAGL
jgi:uncharacterized protein with FMN-binding domain